MIASQLAFNKATLPVIQDVINSQVVEVSPLPGWSDAPGEDIHFQILPTQRNYLSSQFYIRMKFKVLNDDGSNLAPGAVVAFSSLPISSFFSSARISLSGTVVEGLDNYWPIKTFASSLFTQSLVAKQFYSKDLPVEIVLVNNHNSHRIVSDNENGYKIEIMDIVLRSTYLTLSGETEAALNARLSVSPLMYPHFKIQVLSQTMIQANVQEQVVPICRGRAPDLILCGFVKSELFQNLFANNWMDFRCPQLSFIQAEFENKFYPANGLSLDFTNNVGTYEAYQAFIEVCKLFAHDGGCISYAEWAVGHQLLPIRLRETPPSLRYRTTPLTGQLNLKLKFNNPLTDAYNLICLGIFTNSIGMTRDRTVLYDQFS